MFGNKNENPLPTGTTNDQLADDFADFFLNKIDKIREGFRNILAYQPRQLDTPNLKKFTPLTQSQPAKIVKAMLAKTSHLDIIPTDRLKPSTRRLLTNTSTHGKQITRHKPILYGKERSIGQTTDKKTISWPRKNKLQTRQ